MPASEATSSFQTKDVILVARAHSVLREAGLADVSAHAATEQMRRMRIEEIGARQFLYEAIGGHADWPLSYFQLRRNGAVIDVQGDRRAALVDALADLPPERWPDELIVLRTNGNGNGPAHKRGRVLHL